MDLRGSHLFFNPSNGRFGSLSCRFNDEPDRYRGDNRSHLLLYRESLAIPSATTNSSTTVQVGQASCVQAKSRVFPRHINNTFRDLPMPRMRGPNGERPRCFGAFLPRAGFSHKLAVSHRLIPSRGMTESPEMLKSSRYVDGKGQH